MSVDLFETLFVEFFDHRQIDVLDGNDARVGRAEGKRVVALVIHAVDGRRVIGIGPRNDNARDTQDIELQPRRVQPRDDFCRRDQHFLPLMAADLAAGPLILDMNGADLALDKFLHQIPDMVFSAMARVAVRNNQRRGKLNRRRFFSLRRCHSHPVGPLHLILVQQRPHP